MPRWRTFWALVVVLLLIVLIFEGVFFVISRVGSSLTGSTSIVESSQLVPHDVLQAVLTVSAGTFATVGTGHVPNPFTSTLGGSSGASRTPILRDSAGKPIVLFVAAEYCPYCGAERWPMVIALSRFGTFSNLHIISSSATDVYPNTPTFTFYKSTYTSPYIDFQPLEIADRSGKTLQKLTSAQSQIFARYDSNQSIPFIDTGNQYVAIGASYSNDMLAQQDWHSIARVLSDPSSLVTQSIVGTANYITAAICQIDGQQPTNVCAAAPIPTIKNAISKPAGR